MLKGGISQPRNKGLFKMFNLIGLGEHAGSGVPDIFKAWSDAGLDEPVVEEIFGSGNPDRTILTLSLTSPRPSLGTPGTEVSTEVSTEVTTQVKLKPEMLMRLLYFCETPRTRQEMQDFCGIKTEKYFREKIVRPMLAEKMIVRTIPDKPNSKNQKYVAKR